MALIKKYKCMNVGNCKDANKTIFDIPVGEKLECPTCHKEMLVEVKTGIGTGVIAGIVGAVVVIGVGVAYFAFPGKPALEKLNLNKGSLTCVVGGVDTLIVANEPVEASVTYVWSSNNESVATVNNGIVTMKGVGDAIITVKAEGAEDIAATCNYTVNNPESEAGTDGGNDNMNGKVVDGKVVDGKAVDGKAVDGKGTGTETSLPEGYTLGYATYDGPMKGGKAHGIGGTLLVKKNYSIDLKDAKGGMLNVSPGDKIVNTKFTNGVLNQGELQRKTGERTYFVIGG